MKTVEISLPTSAYDIKFVATIAKVVSQTKTSLLHFVKLMRRNASEGGSTIKKLFTRRKKSFEGQDSFENYSSQKEKLPRFGYKTKKKLKIAGIVVVVLIAAVALLRTTRQSYSDDSRIEVKDAKSTLEINKEFVFPLLDEEGEEVSRIRYEILSAELRDEIIVEGKRANSVKGRTFLVLNLKVTNEHKQTIQINTRDYVRLMRNGSDEQLAADIHNDPVAVQAISTKFTRIGLPINDADTDLVLRVGEINGDKEEVSLEFEN